MGIQLDRSLTLFSDLVDRLTDGDAVTPEDEARLADEAAQKLSEMSPSEAFREWLEYTGIIGYDATIRNALWELITSSSEYLTTADRDREEWLKKLLGV